MGKPGGVGRWKNRKYPDFESRRVFSNSDPPGLHYSTKPSYKVKMEKIQDGRDKKVYMVPWNMSIAIALWSKLYVGN